MSFFRNAILGHALSPRDFGIAASMTLLLQLVETLSDLGSDRLIVQADDGEQPKFIATAHSVLAARGLLLSLVMLLCGPFAAQFFAVPEASDMFLWAAAVPFIKGFADLDCRRAQRRFDNRPQILVEVAPQAIALFATLPVVRLAPDYSAVVVLALIQAGATVAMSRLVSASPYRFAADADVARRLVAFGWPILLSALPLIAVYQGDRAIIARLFGVEDLAVFSAAFMITMVPGLLAARAGHALMLPLFAETLRSFGSLKRRFALMCEATAIFASLYLVAFTIAGESLLRIAFGAHYAGEGALVTTLAAMWSLRMLQAVPGMALMAAGNTKPFLVAGALRASVLPLVLFAALHGTSLANIAMIGAAGELASLIYVTLRLERLETGLARTLSVRGLFLLPAALAAFAAHWIVGEGLLQTALWTAAACASISATGIAVMPALRSEARAVLLPLVISPAD